MDYDNLILTSQLKNVKSVSNQHEQSPQFLISQCGIPPVENNNLDIFFNQPSPNKYPALIISKDTKRENQSEDIYKKYMDVIIDDCGNRFNTTNLTSSGADLQIGFARNIDLDSHLKNINYYTDKCYYDNWKLAPNSNLPDCNGLKRNSQILVPDYSAVGRNYADCVGVCSNSAACWNTSPTDLNCETDIRKRYDFSSNNNNFKFQGESCLKPQDWYYFQKANSPSVQELSNYPNRLQNKQVIDALNNEEKHDYYTFFKSNNRVFYPPERLFNNVTKRSMLPNHHFRNVDPVYKC